MYWVGELETQLRMFTNSLKAGKNLLSNKPYGNKMRIKEVEKAPKYETRICGIEAMDKSAENLESSQSVFVPTKDTNEASISDEETVGEN